MRKLLKILMLAFLFSFGATISANAEILWYKTFSMAIKWYNHQYKTWSNWSDWEKCVCLVTIDTDEDTIKIYSNKTQTYHIVSIGEAPYDPDGEQIKFLVVDQDEDRGYVRLRVQNNGTSQIYVDFSDVSWVYNVVKIKQ